MGLTKESIKSTKNLGVATAPQAFSSALDGGALGASESFSIRQK